jgi:MOSC domain-containing protein YiiM
VSDKPISVKRERNEARRPRGGTLGLEGDEQADLSVHGGVDKAVYAYPSEHYPFWRSELSDVELASGAFGENLTTGGLVESELCIGDRLRIGTAEFRVTQPRVPCFKLGIRLGRPDVVKRFLHSGRSGFYLSVLREGTISPDDEIERFAAEGSSLSVAEIARLGLAGDSEPALLRRASELEALPAEWRESFRNRIGGT